MSSGHHSRGVASPSIGLHARPICGTSYSRTRGRFDLLRRATLARARIGDAACVDSCRGNCAGSALVLVIKA